jgi:heme/copper-type cytochrome/quinol oxidase subunit 2
MVALNVVLMAVIVVLIAAALGWAIVSDRRSKRAAAPDEAPLHHNLMMPRQLRVRRMVRSGRRGRNSGSPMS